MYKITFPDERPFTGVYLTVPFFAGTGQTDSDYLAERFIKKGLLVERIEEKKPKKRPPKEADPVTETEEGQGEQASIEEEPEGDF